jgi:hypothetical protein
MTSYKVVLLGIIALAVFSVAVWLFLHDWDPKRPPPPQATVRPCQWPFKNVGEDNTCLGRCGPPYTAGQSPVQAPVGGAVWLYCCPTGYHLDVTTRTCMSN